MEGLGLCINDPTVLTARAEVGTAVCGWWVYMLLCSQNGLSLASGDHGVGDCLTDPGDAPVVLLPW